MGKLKNIKDTTPNPRLIANIEKLLEHAKSGKLRSMMSVLSWEGNSVSHSYYLDPNTYRRLMLAELVMAQHDMATMIGVDDGDSVLAQELYGVDQ